jgi:alkanesulfonate monooxygenase SsuD/methylene tetrahydromethanopterin reductase-like flavin-dependent oxidoreductase (luciferase family)
MITKFGHLYAGYVDLDNIGLEGTPVNERRLSNKQLATVFDKATSIANAMDNNGYDVFWLAEHHFQHEGYECIPNTLLLALHLLHLTKRIKIGCGFNISPVWHPLRLAEDFATVDILTQGRVIFGIGRGYHTREIETFGAPMLDNEANRALFEEQVEIIFKAFNQRSFSHHGEQYDIPPQVPYRGYELKEITLVPRPLNRPVECWQPIVSGGQRGLDLMAKHGIKGVIGGGAARGSMSDKLVHAWRDTLSRAGKNYELGSDLAISFSTHIADSEDKAIKEANPYFQEYMKMFAPLGFVRNITDDQISALSDPIKATTSSIPTLRDAVKTGSWLCGPPELIIERLQEIQERYPGLELVNVGPVVSTPENVIVEQLDWFAKEVMPAFRGSSNK